MESAAANHQHLKVADRRMSAGEAGTVGSGGPARREIITIIGAGQRTTQCALPPYVQRAGSIRLQVDFISGPCCVMVQLRLYERQELMR